MKLGWLLLLLIHNIIIYLLLWNRARTRSSLLYFICSSIRPCSHFILFYATSFLHQKRTSQWKQGLILHNNRVDAGCISDDDDYDTFSATLFYFISKFFSMKYIVGEKEKRERNEWGCILLWNELKWNESGKRGKMQEQSQEQGWYYWCFCCVGLT
jgi:hypothetical protein